MDVDHGVSITADILGGLVDFFNGLFKHALEIDQVGLPHPLGITVVAFLEFEHGEGQGKAGGGVVSAFVDVALHPEQFFIDDLERKRFPGDIVPEDTGVHADVVAVDFCRGAAPADNLFDCEVSGTSDVNVPAVEDPGVGVEKFAEFIVYRTYEAHNKKPSGVDDFPRYGEFLSGFKVLNGQERANIILLMC